MESKAKCDSCGDYFLSHLLKVGPDGEFFCWRSEGEGGIEGCIPNNDIFKRPMASIRFTWINLFYLSEYISGDRSLETLNAIDYIQESIDRALLFRLQTVVKTRELRDGIQESDPESVDTGDGES